VAQAQIKIAVEKSRYHQDKAFVVSLEAKFFEGLKRKRVGELVSRAAPPRVWYRARINSAAEPLSSELEITLLADNSEVLGTVRRFL